jgi:type III secretory pathway component EscR
MDDLLASREPSSYSNYIKRHSIEGKKELFKVEFDKLLSLLTTRYGNEIREDDIIVLMQEFAEWIDSHNYKPHSANRNEAY